MSKQRSKKIPKSGKTAFAASHGAMCSNYRNAWSYINREDRTVIFGAWEHNERGDDQLIFSLNWERPHSGFAESFHNIECVLEDDYELFTFRQLARNPGKRPASTKSYTPELERRWLIENGGNFIAKSFPETDLTSPRQGEDPESHWEGAEKNVVQTIRERNKKARQICLLRYGHVCAVCGFDFERAYGELGQGYIHVHHLVKVADRKAPYKVDPINDLRPVCPNCHAMIHKRKDPYTIDEMKGILNSDWCDGARQKE